MFVYTLKDVLAHLWAQEMKILVLEKAKRLLMMRGNLLVSA